MSRRIVEVTRQGRVGADGQSNLIGVVTTAVDASVVNADSGKAYRCTAALTLTLPAATSPGWSVIVDADGGDVTLASTMTVNGSASIVLSDGNSCLVYSDGSALFARFYFADEFSSSRLSGIAAGDGVGEVFLYAGATAPPGSLVADGSAVSRATYSALFAAISTTWGAGDGGTTFNIPDLRDRYPRGKSATHDVGAYLASQNLSHAHGVNDPTHAHGVSDPGHVHGSGIGGNFFINLAGGSPGWAGGGTFANAVQLAGTTDLRATGIGIFGAATGVSVQASGGTEARPNTTTMLFCIRY